MKYRIVTFGCRTNQADSFDIERGLRARGGEESPVTCADVVVVNTCSVTATAEQTARQAIRRVRRLNPGARVVVTGCYARRAPAEIQSLGAVECAAHVGMAGLAKPRNPPSFGDGPNGLDAEIPLGKPRPMPGPGTRDRTIYLLRVQTGCDQSCSYCIVPSTRGPGRSVPVDQALDEVAQAAAAGFKEVMLTGVHLGSYGRDLDPRLTLADLVSQVARHPARVRVRISAVEPMDLDRRLIDALADSGRVARHFHLPLQHASDRLLAAMRRPYTLEDYTARVDALRAAFPDAAIGTDVMVGFPGETEDDFECCDAFLRRSCLAYLHVFPFSPRPGTEAERMTGRPDSVRVRARVARLRELGSDLNRAFRTQFVGRCVDGLTIQDGSLVLTDNYLTVRVARGLKRNERVTVSIHADGDPMLGTVEALQP